MPSDELSSLFNLTGKIALVTGGSRGIGLAIARALALAGAGVVIASRKQDMCDAAAAAVAAETGSRAVGMACHVGHWTECEQLVHKTYSEFGRCDILVNNAGLSPRYDSLSSITEAYYDRITAVNLKGPFRLAALAGERMMAGSGGSIINVSSIGSLRPSAGELVYSCAKAGLNAMTVGMAEAFGPSVRVNAILPGAVRTTLTSGWTTEMFVRAESTLPLARIGLPADFVGPAVWLASDASAYVTGELVRVDGGRFRQTG